MASPPPESTRSLRRSIKTPARFQGDHLDMSGAPSIGTSRRSGNSSTRMPQTSSSEGPNGSTARQRPGEIDSISTPSTETMAVNAKKVPRVRKIYASSSRSRISGNVNNSSSSNLRNVKNTGGSPGPAAPSDEDYTAPNSVSDQPSGTKRAPRKATARRPPSRDSLADNFVPKQSRVPKNTYTGPVTDFNPDLRPAAFPTLDTPERAAEFELELAAAEKRIAADVRKLQESIDNAKAPAPASTSLSGHSLEQRHEGTSFERRSLKRSHEDVEIFDALVDYPGSTHAHPAKRHRKATNPDLEWEFGSSDASLRDGYILAGGRTQYDNFQAEMQSSDEGEMDEETPTRKLKTKGEFRFTLSTVEPARQRQEIWLELPNNLKCHAVETVGDIYPNYKEHAGITHAMGTRFEQRTSLEQSAVEAFMDVLLLSERDKSILRGLLDIKAQKQRLAELAQKYLDQQRHTFFLKHGTKKLTDAQHEKMKVMTIYKYPEPDLEAPRSAWVALEKYFEMCELDPMYLYEDGGLLNAETGVREEGLQVDRALSGTAMPGSEPGEVAAA